MLSLQSTSLISAFISSFSYDAKPFIFFHFFFCNGCLHLSFQKCSWTTKTSAEGIVMCFFMECWLFRGLVNLKNCKMCGFITAENIAAFFFIIISFFHSKLTPLFALCWLNLNFVILFVSIGWSIPALSPSLLFFSSFILLSVTNAIVNFFFSFIGKLNKIQQSWKQIFHEIVCTLENSDKIEAITIS